MTHRMRGLGVSLLGFLVPAAPIHNMTGLIDDANSRRILISHHEES
ncbi:hypothetical protein [Mycobacterium gallinarum]|nr:hypothetical protein [Mycobacterium gallinarum]